MNYPKIDLKIQFKMTNRGSGLWFDSKLFSSTPGSIIHESGIKLNLRFKFSCHFSFYFSLLIRFMTYIDGFKPSILIWGSFIISWTVIFDDIWMNKIKSEFWILNGLYYKLRYFLQSSKILKIYVLKKAILSKYKNSNENQ